MGEETAGTSLEQLRQSVRAAIKQSPHLIVQPVFQETETEYVYSFGGVNYRFLKGGQASLTPSEQIVNDMTRVELLRTGMSGNAASSAYWKPVLDRVEEALTEELALLDRDDLDSQQRQALLDSSPEKIEHIFREAIESVAKSYSRRALPLDVAKAWPRPTFVVEQRYQPVSRIVTEQIPVTQMQTQYHTEYRTVQVPVTREVIEYTQVTRNQIRYRRQFRPGTGYVNVPETVPTTELVPQRRQVTEMATRQFASTVPVQVPVTVMGSVERQITEFVTVSVPVQRTPQEYRVTIKMNPPGGNVFYLDQFTYTAMVGHWLRTRLEPPDDFATWKKRWNPAANEEMLGGDTTYQFRARWDGTRRFRAQKFIDHDTELPVSPND
jgi:hypothetical protein